MKALTKEKLDCVYHWKFIVVVCGWEKKGVLGENGICISLGNAREKVNLAGFLLTKWLNVPYNQVGGNLAKTMQTGKNPLWKDSIVEQCHLVWF